MNKLVSQLYRAAASKLSACGGRPLAARPATGGLRMPKRTATYSAVVTGCAMAEALPFRRKALFESLEPRVLLSADLLPGAVPALVLATEVVRPTVRMTAAPAHPTPQGPSPQGLTPQGLTPQSLTLQVDAAALPFEMHPIGPVEGGVQVATSRSGSFVDTAVALGTARFSYALQAAAGQLISVAASALDRAGTTEVLTALELRDANGTLVAQGSGNSQAALQAVTALLAGTYTVLLRAQVLPVEGGNSAVTVDWRVDAALDALLEAEAFLPDDEGNDSLGTADLMQQARALPLSGAARTAVVGRLTPGSNDGRIDTDLYRISLAAGETLQVESSLRSQYGFLQLLNAEGLLMATSQRTGENMSWQGPTGLPLFVAPVAGDYLLKLELWWDNGRTFDAIDYTLLVGRNVSLDPDSDDELGLGATQLGAIANPVIVAGSELEPQAAAPQGSAVYGATVTAETVVIDLLPLADGRSAGVTQPILRLLDEAGALVAWAAVAPPAGQGGHRFTASAAIGSRLWIEISSAQDGQFLLQVQGAAGNNPPPSARHSSLDDGLAGSTAPWQYLQLSEAFRADLAGTLQLLNGAGVLLSNLPVYPWYHDSGLGFNLPQGLAAGSYTLVAPAGMFVDLTDQPSAAMRYAFVVDGQRPQLLSTTPANGAELPVGQAITLQFNEAMASNWPDPTFLDSAGQPVAVNWSYAWSADARSLTITVNDSLPEGLYSLSLPVWALNDAAGNEFDADPAADDTQAFMLQFSVDQASYALPALRAREPLGALVYTTGRDALLGNADDVDEFSFELIAGQMFSAVLSSAAGQPASSLPQLDLAIFDPEGNQVASASTSVAGRALLVPDVTATSGGIWRLRVHSGAGQTGAYSAGVVLGAAVQREFVEVDGTQQPSNGTREHAEDLDSTSRVLSGDIDRLASVGRFSPGLNPVTGLPTSDWDFFRFTLQAGQTASIIVAVEGNPAISNLRMGLFDDAGDWSTSSGTLVAAAELSPGADRVILDYTNHSDQAVTLFARPRAETSARYSMVVMRGATFDIGLLDGQPQALGPTGAVLGYVGEAPGATDFTPITTVDPNLTLTDGQGYRWDFNSHGAVNDGSANAFDGAPYLFYRVTDGPSDYLSVNTAKVDASGREITIVREVLPGLVISRSAYVPEADGFARFFESVRNDSSETRTVSLELNAWMGFSNGSLQVVNSSSAPSQDYTPADQWLLTDDATDHDGSLAVAQVSWGRGGQSPNQGYLSGNYLYRSWTVVVAPGETASVMHFAVQAHNRADAQATAERLVSLPPEALAGLGQPALDSVVNFEADLPDSYRVWVNSGDTLQLSVDAVGTEALPLRLRLMDPEGNLQVDTGTPDGAINGLSTSHTAQTSGAWRVQVMSPAMPGEYLLQVQGATAQAPAPRWVASSPAQGQGVAAVPAWIDVGFDQFIRSDSVSIDDLRLDDNALAAGVAVASVEVRSGRSFRFHLTSATLPEGPVFWSIAEGALISHDGQGNQAVDGVFVIDNTAPQVVGHTPDTTTVVQLNSVVFDFSETLDPSSISVADVVAFTGPSGADIRDRIISVIARGASQVVVTLQNQTATGEYSLTLGPDIRDVAGNLLDQDGDGTPGEAGEDSYTATFTVAAVDLVVEAITLPEALVAGAAAQFSWTVRNTGNLPVADSVGWYDRVYLFAADNSSAWYLGDVYRAAGVALAPGDSYELSGAFTIPLRNGLPAGDYRLQVTTDIYNQQPEQDDNNNTFVSAGTLPLTLPDLPDLLPSSFVVPSTVSAGGGFSINWTTSNQGPGDTRSGFQERLDLVDLDGNIVYITEFYTYPAVEQYKYIGGLAAGVSVDNSMTVYLPRLLPEGQYRLRLTTDAFNSELEAGGESNNVLLSEIFSLGLMDLVPVQITAPTAVTLGEQITVDWSVVNNGANGGYYYESSWTDQVQLVNASTGIVAFTRDVYNYAELAAGASYNNSVSFTVPVIVALTGGDYTVRVLVDVYNHRIEGNDDNNRIDADQPLAIAVPAVPDLQISAITVPTSVAGHTGLAIDWTITNQGAAETTSGFTDRFWLVDTNGSATYLGEAYQYSALAPGASLTRTQSFTVPHTLAVGTYQVRIATDHYGGINELQGEDNNLALSAQFQVTTAIIADLQIQDISAPAGITLGQAVTVEWIGVNQGTGATTGGWYDRIELLNTAGSVVYTTYAWISQALAVAETYAGSLTLTLPISASYAEGDYRFRVITDGYPNYQVESNESNNGLTDTALVALVAPPTPDLGVSAIVVPASAPANTRITVTWDETNAGDGASTGAYYSRVEVLAANGGRWYAADPLFAAIEIAPGTAVARSHEILLPVGMPPGSYTVRITADRYNFVAEYDGENNNVTTSAAFNVTEALRADLGNVRLNSALPESATLGTSLSVAYSVDNLGVGSTQNLTWTDRVRVVLASDTSVVLASVNVSAGNSATGVPAGGSYSRTVNVALPLHGNYGPGSYLVQVLTDVNGNLNELDRSNNNLSLPLTLQLPPLANLVVRNVVVPAALNAGATVNVSWVTANTGTGDLYQRYGGVNYFYDRVALADSSGNIVVASLGEFLVYGPLPAGTELARVQSVTLPENLADGNYRIVVLTDIHDYINEHSGEGDNRGSSAVVAISQPPRVDLQASSLVLPDAARTGAPLVLTWRTSNAGQVDFAGAFNEQVQISSTADFSADVRNLQPVTRFTGTITAGGGVDRSAEVLVPIELNGPSTVSKTWYLRVVTDSSNEVYEYALENNNSSAISALVVNRPDLPDLQVDTVDSQEAAVAGTEVVVTYTVTNHGTQVAGARSDEIRLVAEDGVLWTLTQVKPISEPLAAGASQTLQARFTLPISNGYGGGFFGRLRAQVLVDSAQQVQEYPNDGNNTRSDSNQMLVTLPPLPDLAVTDISAPLDALTEAEVPVRWTITNTGTAATGAGWTDRLYLSTDGVLGSDRYLGDFVIDTSLAAGASIERVQNITLPRDLTGPFRLIVITDIGGNLYEGPNSEGADNITVDDRAMTLLQRPLPNLVVTSVTPPDNAFSGQAVAVSWTVKNTGTSATTVPSWRDSVYLSLDDVLDGADINLGSSENPGYLDVNGEYANSLTATLPRGIDGNYRFLVVTDIHDQLFEGVRGSAAEADNTSSPALARVTLTPPPDLVVTTVGAPLQSFSGEPIAITWEVANVGDGGTRSAAWYDRVWLSTDTVLGNDVFLGDVFHSGALDSTGATSTYAGSLLAAMPIGLTGDFHIIVVTDIYNGIYEHTSETNNSLARETVTTVVLTPPPDLEVVSTEFADTARAGTTFTLNYRVENLGASATPSRQSWWTDSAWLSLDELIGVGDIALGSFSHYGTLDTDAGYDGVITAQLPGNLQGSYRLLVKTDAGSAVFEGSGPGESNNTLVAGAVDVYLIRPDLQVTAFAMPAAVEAGRTATFSWTVGNLGAGDSITADWSDSLWVSLDDDLGDSDDVLIGSVAHAGVLAPAGSYTVTVAPVLPFALSGSGRFYVRTDGGGQVVEANDSNNLSAVLRTDISRRESDLVVTEAVVTPVDGDARSFDLRYEVHNSGVASTNVNAWNDGIWLSGDDFIGAGDTRVKAVYRGNPLAAGESYTVNTRVTVPAGVPAGAFKVLVRADDDNTVIEGLAENNNLAVAAVTLGGVPVPGGQLSVGEIDLLEPDLTVVTVDAPEAAFSGQQITVRWTSRNQGVDDASSPYWWAQAYDQVFLSSDLFLDNTDLSLGYLSHGGQTAGSEVERSLTAQLPVGRSGLFYVLVKADAGNRFAEPGAEGNNIGFDPALLSITLAPPADLVAGLISLPATAAPGLGMDVTYTVNNHSSNSALGNWRDALYLSKDDVFDTGDVFFGAVNISGPVAGGGSYTSTVHATVPGVDPGDYKLIVRSDVRNVLVEANEANNLSASVDAVALDVPELTLGLASTGNLPAGQSLFFKVSVGAGEALRFSLDGPGDDVAHDMFISFDAVPSRSRNDIGTGEQFTPDPVLTVPTTEAGVYYVRIDSSQFASGAFSLRADLVPFSVEAVTEDTLGNTGEATVRADGARFDNTTRFQLVAADGTVYQSVAVALRDAGRAYVTFDLFAATTGSYDLRALDSTAGGSALESTLADALTVIDGIGADAFLTIAGPTAIQVNRDASFTLNYSNDGDADTLAPLMIVTPSNGTTVGLSSKALSGAPLFILGASLDGPVDLLRPGARYSLPVAYKSPGETGFLSIEARPVQANSTELITDWSVIERSLRPTQIDFATWQAFWGRVQPAVGSTLGNLVQVLNEMAVRLSPAGDPIRDVRALFAAQLASDAHWMPSQRVSGVLLGAGSGAAQAGVEVQIAYLQGDRLRVEASTITAADGSFSFNRVGAGSYFLALGGRQFDLDRDGVPDQTAPTLTVDSGSAPLIDTLYLFDDGLGEEINREDSRTELLTDSAGVVHAFWQRGDRLYHAYRDSAGDWVDARAVSHGVPGEIAVAAGDHFVNSQAGLIAVWSEGVENESELYYAIGRANDGGGYEWSNPVRLTTNTVADVAPAVVVDGAGQAVITFLRRDFTIQDDSDLYYATLDPDTTTLVWNDAVLFNPEVVDEPALAGVASGASGELEPQLSTTYRFGYSKDIGEWNIAGFYIKAGFEGTLVATLDDQACETTVGGQVKGSAEIKVASKGKVVGEAALYANAKWTVDSNTQDWQFAGASADFNGSVKYVWRDGIYDVMSAFPALTPIANLLRQGQNFINKASGGAVRIQNGVVIGPLAVEFKGMKWNSDAPFPNFFMPQTLDSAAVSGSLGLYARAYSSYWGGIDLSLEGSVGLKATVYPGFKLEGTAQASVTGKIGGWTIFNGEWQGSTTFVEGSELSAQADGNDPTPFLMLRWDPQATLGSTNVYGSGAVDAQVASNRLGDSPMVLARNADGSVAGLFARDGDAATGEIGTELYLTKLGAGGWTDETVIDGSLGFNGDGKLVALADGRRVAVWTHASTASLSSTSTMDEIFAARDVNDVYYAIDSGNGSGFGTPVRLAATTGTDAELAVTTTDDGTVVIAWTSTGDDGVAHLMSATVGEAGAGTAIEVASGLLSNVSVTAASGGEVVFSWDRDTDPTADGVAFEVHTASLIGGVLTGNGFDVAPLTAEFAKIIGLSVEGAGAAAGQVSVEGLFPPFAVPEDCKKCTPEKLKKITEAAPDCRPGGGSSTTTDTKKCEQKTITYAPCVTRPSDPNDIIGPDGFGEQRWTKASAALPYTIRFENQASATAPAQVVTVTQTLDADLDARSFRITGFGFADVRVQPDDSRSKYGGRLDLRESQGIYLDVFALIDVTTRQITWTFTSIDPATGEVPVDATKGFLLPNDDSGRGDGFVSYTVKPLRAVTTGTVIDAQARIVFDSEGPIDTPPIFNTLDTGTPSSRVEALGETTDSNTFTVRWSGTDAANGSALRDYEVYVSTDGGDWELWQLATAVTEAVFEGEPGHRYAFYSVARDNAGNIEAAPATADTEIRVLAQTGSVSGRVFNDIDFDGVRDDGEAALAGWTVFVDGNADGDFDDGEATVSTGDDGSWQFAALQPGVWRVLIEPRSGHEVTTPVAGYFDVAVEAGDALTGRDFGVLQLGSIAGVQFDDLDGDGRRDNGEAGLAGWTIFIDNDSDGQLDAGERRTVTAPDGRYAFVDLRPGAYEIGQVAQPGWIQTRPGTASADGSNGNGSNSTASGSTAFAVTLSGSLASISLPACACGGTVTTVAAQQAGWDEQLVELDALRADPGLAGVDGSGIRIVVIDTGIDASHPFFDGRIVYQYDFADNDTQAIDRNGHGTHVAGVIAGNDAMFGGVAPGAELIVLKVFGDDGSGSFRSLERALQWVLNNAEAYNIGVVNLSLGDGGNWTDAGSRYGLGDEFAALAARNIINVAAAGNNYAAQNALGVAYPGSDPAVLAVGAVWAGDFGGPWKFGNGGIDEATGADHVASFSQRDPDQTDIFAPGARLTSAAIGGGVRTMQGTSQSAAYVSGVAALAQQLARQHLGRSLSVAEFRELLVSTAARINDGDDERDNVANSGLDFPRLDVKRMADAILALAGGQPGGGGGSPGHEENPAPVDPASGAGNLVVTLAPGQQVVDADFGVFKLGSAGGVVFDDRDGNGLQGAGESGIAGASLFVDANANGQQEDTEMAFSTGADGHWQLDNLLPGSLRVVQTLPAGWARSGPAGGAHSVTVTSGLAVGTLDFGRYDIAPEALADSASTPQGRAVSGNVLANDTDPGRPDNGLLVVSLVSGPAHGSLTLGTDGAFVYQPVDGYEGTDSFRYAASDGVSQREATVSLNITHQWLQVQRLDGRHDGFEVVFTRAIVVADLNIGGAAADVVVTNSAGQPVAGSLFVAADGRSARFIASGGLLADGSYALRLVAGAQALRDNQGVALDGNGDGAAGDDHLGSFVVARGNAVSVGLADTARGPGQVLGVALADTGLAVRLSDGSGVTSVSFTLAYDSALLGLATVARGADLPAGVSFSATEVAPGQISVVIGSATALPAGALTLARLVATIPSDATYGLAQVLDVRNLLVNAGALAALDDDAVHVAAFPGDLNRDRQHGSDDVSLMRSLLGGAIARLPAWALLDGRLLGDVNGSGRLDAVDPLRLEQALAGSTGLIVAIPGPAPAPTAPPVVTPAPVVRTVVPRIVPKVVPRLISASPTWVSPLVTSSATIAANVNIRVVV